MTSQVRTIPARAIPGSLIVGPFKAEDSAAVLTCVIPGDPVSKQRPRWNRKTHTAYTPAETRHREAGIAAIARAASRELITDDSALFSLRAGFYLKGNQARDVDNMLKLVADALTGVVWADDRQVVEVFGFKIIADRPEEARTEVAIFRVPGMMAATLGQCQLCKRAFRTYPSWRFRRFCSFRCASIGQQKRESVVCGKCGKPFDVPLYRRRQPTKHYFCSLDCKRTFGRVERVCVECGAVFHAQQSARKKTCSRHCATQPSMDSKTEADGMSAQVVATPRGVRIRVARL